MPEPLSAPVVERMTLAFAQLPHIKSPGSDRTHARAGEAYLYLSFNADRKTGEVFRSIRTIAGDVGCSLRQASDGIDLLVALDLIGKRLGTPEAGRWPSCIYTLLRPPERVTVDRRRRSIAVGDSEESPSAVPGNRRRRSIADYPGTTDPTATPDPDRAHAREGKLRGEDESERSSSLSELPPEADGVPPEMVKALRDLDPAEIVRATGLSALYLVPYGFEFDSRDRATAVPRWHSHHGRLNGSVA